MRPRSRDPLDPALDLEEHAKHAILVGLGFAVFLHAMAVAHALLTPTEVAFAAPPRALSAVEFEVGLANTPVTPAPIAVPPPAPPVPSPVLAKTITTPKKTTPAPDPAPAPVPPAPPSIAVLAQPEPEPPPPPPPPVVAAITRVVRHGPDRSSPARLGGAVQWRWPWPKEADREMRHMVVKVAADVRSNGTPAAIRVVSDPGYGFGAAAQTCAMQHTYVPSRDESGQEADGTTMPFSVYFDRY